MTNFDFSYIFRYYPDILPFLGVTFRIAIFSILFGTLLGFVVAVAKLSKNKFFRVLGNGYTNVLRCTPAVILLFLVYYGVPFVLDQFFGWETHFHKGVFVVIALSLLFSASMSEIMRSAYEAVNKGQYEAGVSVGMTGTQTFFRILLPQCFVIALPNLGNAIIQMIQEGALAFTIGFIDIMGQTDLIVSRNYGAHAREVYIGLALLYWAIAILIERGMAFIEKKYKDRTLSRTV